MKIAIIELRNLITTILQNTYYSSKQAKQIADVLLYAELTGKNTQGVLKLLGEDPLQNINPEKQPQIVKETKLSALIDGGGNPGMLVSTMATQMSIQKCKEHGFGIVGTNNTFSSTGVIGYYAGEITKYDFIGIVMAGSPGGVAPYGSIDPLLGTNPMAFGFPTTEWPIIYDSATAAITWYGLVRAKALGQNIPKGVAIDTQGDITTDPQKAMEGSILPFDNGYKSSGLSLIVELFTGPLVQAMYPGSDMGGWGNVFIAIDPDLLTTKEAVKKASMELIMYVKKSRKAKGHDIVHIPGWKGLDRKEKAEKAGEVEIDEKIYNELKRLVT